MKYEAVIFDLFGTLINKFSVQDSHNVLRQMASVLSADPESFIRYWYDTFDERGTGVFQSFEANIEYICRELGIPADKNQVIKAAQIDRDYANRFMKPRPYAVELLEHLKAEQYKTGLITNCSAEVPYIWDRMPFAKLMDAAIFSCSIRIQKPDPRIYMFAVEQLKVKPERCLYIGDGDSNELTGARAAGMNPVLIRDPDEDINDVHRVNYEANTWDGPVISSLKDVLNLVEPE